MSDNAVYFVTGTDTDAGKTLVSCALLAAAGKVGLDTAAAKPVAAGGINTERGVQNEDALLLSGYCQPPLSVEEINPLCFQDPVAPHLAAQKTGEILSAEILAEHCRTVISRKADLTVIEGAGGWLVPLNDHETLADLPGLLGVPVILVVGMRLGCLSHALLTVESIQARGVTLAGWVANCIDPAMSLYKENLASLCSRIPAPLLGEIPWIESAENEVSGDRVQKASACLSLDLLKC